MIQQKKLVVIRYGFKMGEFIVYFVYGVGQIVIIEEQEVVGMKFEFFVIDFEKDKMWLKVLVVKVVSIGMCKFFENDSVEKVLKVVQGKVCVKCIMWLCCVQEYDVKINFGDLIVIVEVVCDLYCVENQLEQFYFECQFYEVVFDCMVCEIVVVNCIFEMEVVCFVEMNLNKGLKCGKVIEEDDVVEEEEVV